jgi:hypothetical protein
VRRELTCDWMPSSRDFLQSLLQLGAARLAYVYGCRWPACLQVPVISPLCPSRNVLSTQTRSLNRKYSANMRLDGFESSFTAPCDAAGEVSRVPGALLKRARGSGQPPACACVCHVHTPLRPRSSPKHKRLPPRLHRHHHFVQGDISSWREGLLSPGHCRGGRWLHRWPVCRHQQSSAV